MTYEEARDWLDNVSKKGNLLGLARMYDLVHELGDPQKDLRFVHIAGTNGKGSVMTYLEHTLALAGYKVGRYLSPALFCYEEKIRVNEAYIPRETVAELTGVLREACARIEAAGREAPTIFEVETALAFLYFQREGCDLVLLEVGMGGETDATNVVDGTVLEIFSSISLDHMEFLGDTVEAIASVKAGILKKGSLAVSARQSAGVAEVLKSRAESLGVPLSFVREEALGDVHCELARQSFIYDGERIEIGMPGTWQIDNACTALEAVRALRRLGWRLEAETVRAGFAGARLEGRFELLDTAPTIIMDGAHNPDAARRLRESLLTYFPDHVRPQTARDGAASGKGKADIREKKGRLLFVMGVFADKDYGEEIALTAPLADQIYTVQTKDNPRALPADALAAAIRPVNPRVESVGEVADAMALALDNAKPEDVIILFGSLSWLIEARAYMEKRQ